ncbi:MAG: ABC transporter substrate-binding protein [Casimicrobiaceae bacterium]|nr:ABC transporter substrate-binding protein [Casimicrobiaceae bacterium]
MRILVLVFLWLASTAHAGDCPRIVSQSPYITRALAWFGLERCIVGVSRYDTLERPRTGGILDPDTEAIALLAPQLMITSNWTKAELWEQAAPPGAKALRVDGFRGMDGVERMLREIGHAAGVPDTDARVDRFAAQWRAAARLVGGGGRRVLILSACHETPYSFGRTTTLHELFATAGFEVVADHDGIRNFHRNQPGGDIAAWIRGRRPDYLFVLRNRRDEACNAAIAALGIPILPLESASFTHPGPALLEGLEQLRSITAELAK